MSSVWLSRRASHDHVAGKHGGCNRGDGRFRHRARRLINSSRDGVSADLIRAPGAAGRKAGFSFSLPLSLPLALPHPL